MKRCALLLSLLLCLGLTGCSPTEAEVPAMPVQAAEAIGPEEMTAEPLTEVRAGSAETPEPEEPSEAEPEPVLLASGPDILLFGVWSPTLETADGTLLVPAAQFADGGRLILPESADAAVLCRMGERLRLAASMQSGRMGNSGSTVRARRSASGCSRARRRTASSILRAPRTPSRPRRTSTSPS